MLLFEKLYFLFYEEFPSFTQAGDPKKAEELYEYIIKECSKEIDVVQTGVFGAHMEVALINDGPFTVVLEDL